MSNIYESADQVRARVAAGDHRGVIGGLWEEMGAWQLSLLQEAGLRPHHHVLDVGCGSLRAGVPLVRYLDPDHYAGVDAHRELLDAGYDQELTAQGLQDRLMRKDLVTTDRFDFSAFGSRRFDYALAQSVFTHLNLNHIKLCLANLVCVMARGSKLYASYFRIDESTPLDARLDRGQGIVTQFDANPFHHRDRDLIALTDDLPVTARPCPEIDNHPRGQSIMEFTFHDRPADNGATRRLSVDQALNLKAGDDHYRAFVGPPRRYDFMSATQFALLHVLGLREEDHVLDIGCGSLRLGRLLIPFLREGRYCGIDPEIWLIHEAISKELGRDAVALKSPQFVSNADFDFSSFDRRFQYIIAQSVATHTGPDLLTKMIAAARESVAEDGLFLFSYIRGEAGCNEAPKGWHYPDCVHYAEDDMIARLLAEGFVGRPIPWFHPAASWMIAARQEAYLPPPSALARMDGFVWERPASEKGYVTLR